MNTTIEHVFFDLDHTLWDFDKNSGLTFKKIFSENKMDVNLDDFLTVYEPINLKYWRLYRDEKVTKSELRYKRLKEAFDGIKKVVEYDMINKLAEAYIAHLSNFNHLFHGTFEILDYLKDRYTLHIITNGFEEIQEKKMKGSDIRDYFKTITNSEMVGVKKPNPKIFNFALDLAKANPSNSVMIGDSLEADVQGAFNIGMQAIHFDPKDHHGEHDFKRITNLMALKHHL